jgi:uncharacterized Zn finger protein
MVITVSPSDVLALVRGDSGDLYEVTWSRARGWRCGCVALGMCSHAFAIASVVLTNQTPGGWIDVDGLFSRNEASA